MAVVFKHNNKLENQQFDSCMCERAHAWWLRTGQGLKLKEWKQTGSDPASPSNSKQTLAFWGFWAMGCMWVAWEPGLELHVWHAGQTRCLFHLIRNFDLYKPGKLDILSVYNHQTDQDIMDANKAWSQEIDLSSNYCQSVVEVLSIAKQVIAEISWWLPWSSSWWTLYLHSHQSSSQCEML